jgi:hypothetical protein
MIRLVMIDLGSNTLKFQYYKGVNATILFHVCLYFVYGPSVLHELMSDRH